MRCHPERSRLRILQATESKDLRLLLRRLIPATKLHHSLKFQRVWETASIKEIFFAQNLPGSCKRDICHRYFAVTLNFIAIATLFGR